MKEQSESFKIESERVVSLGRVLQVCTSQRMNDVQGFDWDKAPTFNQESGRWMNTRVIRTWRQDQHKSDWD
tara:strand:- start:131 stop:343 length:213 start_codon:yes stop_codon:yes gene_type:complete